MLGDDSTCHTPTRIVVANRYDAMMLTSLRVTDKDSMLYVYRIRNTLTPEKPKVSEVERDLNEIIPILAHVCSSNEQKGFSGKVRVQALAGDTWGVAKSPDNSTDIPNVIIYPRESLSGDRRLVNARLRHEIGNLNYPIDSEINALRGWCYENKVAPELLTSLVEATHEASVNYLEMQNSHSDTPQENFRALYEQEINTQQIADGVAQPVPYKQAVDLAPSTPFPNRPRPVRAV